MKSGLETYPLPARADSSRAIAFNLQTGSTPKRNCHQHVSYPALVHKFAGQERNLLIVDDEPQVRECLRELLSDEYVCSTAGSAGEALALLETRKFALVLSDIWMPGVTGLQMLPHIAAASPETVVMMISGEGTIESAIEAMRAGAFDYVTKPFDIQHVLAAVARAYQHHVLRVTKVSYENHLEELIEQRTAERDRLAYYDPLTNLPNRAMFEDRLAQALPLAQRCGKKLAVAFLCIDRFKKFADTLGHATADELLCQVGARLKTCMRDGDTLARFGSDEFSLLLAQAESAQQIASAADSFEDVLRAPFMLNGQEFFLTASIGIGLHPDDATDSQRLLQHAGAALYRAKQQGGNQYQFFTPGANEHALKRLAFESSLRRAVEREEFVVHYQPQVLTDSCEIIGVEALVRWQHPELGLVSPAEFIPLAEDTGLIVQIGEWVLRTACAQTKAWQDAGFPQLRVAVNLSPRQFRHADLVAMVRSTLAETRLDATALELELTEGSVMEDGEQAIATLRELNALGIKISIDDFGLGYSSLSRLTQLPIDVLKIDQSFVRDATENPENAAIMMAIITLAHSLKLKVVAEGVEEESQYKFLRLLRCDYMQGYLFSKPLTTEALARLLKERIRLIVK